MCFKYLKNHLINQQTLLNIINPFLQKLFLSVFFKFNKKGINDCIKTNNFQTKQKRKKLKKREKGKVYKNTNHFLRLCWITLIVFYVMKQ